VRAEWRCVTMFLLVVGAGIVRAAINFGSGVLPAHYFVDDPAMLFDFALDAETASVALILGVTFYIPTGGRLLKPGTANAITASTVAFCSYFVFIAFIATIVPPIIAHAWAPQGLVKGLIAIIFPDLCALVALAITVVELT
jgi:hypothetical protein